MLNLAGYRAVAIYSGKDADVRQFHDETGTSVCSRNVADFDACQVDVQQILKKFGSVDVLVNNAGITRDATLRKMTIEQWRSVIDVDLGGCLNLCNAVIDIRREQRFGRIANISSINALTGQFGQTNYAAAKVGIIGFTKSLALEGAARGITVNAIAPGYTDNAMAAAVRPDILKGVVASVPAPAPGEARRDSARRVVSGRRRGRVRQWSRTLDKRRQIYGVRCFRRPFKGAARVGGSVVFWITWVAQAGSVVGQSGKTATSRTG